MHATEPSQLQRLHIDLFLFYDIPDYVALGRGLRKTYFCICPQEHLVLRDTLRNGFNVFIVIRYVG